MTATESVAAHLGGDFLAQVYRQTHRIFRAAVPEAADLLTFDDLNAMLAAHRFEPPRMRLSMDGETLPIHRYALAQTTRRNTVWQQLQPAELHQRLAEGATFVLDAIDEVHPAIGDLASGIERTLRTGVQVNAYASWTAAEGFGRHWDDHDTLIIQLAGAKRWKIYGPTRKHPTFRDVTAPLEPTGDPIDEFVIEAGDLLYVPRGHWHAVSASEGVASLHLTCGLQTTTGADLISFLADELREHDNVRADLPQFAGPTKQKLYIHQLADDIATLLEDENLLRRFFDHRDVTDPGRFTPSLPHVAEAPHDPASTVRLTTPRAHLDRTEDTVILRAGGERWELAPAAYHVLTTLIDGRARSLSDLAEISGLPMPDIAELANELVRQQVATIGSAA
jgi:ribosomal protein L16 Arg81 hydroxylase